MESGGEEDMFSHLKHFCAIARLRLTNYVGSSRVTADSSSVFLKWYSTAA